jgi:hypothetical protein
MTGQPTGGDKVAVDSSGNVYVTGGFQGTANFGSTNLTSIGSEDIFLAKYNGSPITATMPVALVLRLMARIAFMRQFGVLATYPLTTSLSQI